LKEISKTRKKNGWNINKWIKQRAQ
jgi:hypothetical protein